MKVGEPDIYLEDGQRNHLGDFEIKAIFTPGHSRGHMCFGIDTVLFTGDLLYYRTVGHTGWVGGSDEQLKKSVHRLYDLFSDEIIVYPGHGQTTNIGSEKRENEKVRSKPGND